MSTHISSNQLKEFLTQTLGTRSLNKSDAIKNGIKSEKFEEIKNLIEEDDSLSIDEILEDKDLYAQFANMCIQEQKENEKVDKEKQEEEQNKVQGSGNKSKA